MSPLRRVFRDVRCCGGELLLKTDNRWVRGRSLWSVAPYPHGHARNRSRSADNPLNCDDAAQACSNPFSRRQLHATSRPSHQLTVIPRCRLSAICLTESSPGESSKASDLPFPSSCVRSLSPSKPSPCHTDRLHSSRILPMESMACLKINSSFSPSGISTRIA